MFTGIVAEQHDAVGVGEITHREPPVGQFVDRGRVARAQRHAANPVRRTEQVHEAAVCRVRRLRVPAGDGNGETLGTVAGDHLLQALGDLVHRLLVTDRLPFVSTALAHPIQRRAQPVRVVVDARCSYTFEADVPGESWMVVGENPLHLAVLRSHT